MHSNLSGGDVNCTVGGSFTLLFDKFEYSTGTVVQGDPLPYSFQSDEANKNSVSYVMLTMLQAMTQKVELGEGHGSGWKFKRLNGAMFTAAFGTTLQGMSRVIIGGKRRIVSSGSETDNDDPTNNIMVEHHVARYRKKNKVKKKSAFILAECDVSGAESGDESDIDSECEADRVLIDDDSISEEEYQPMNYFQTDEASTYPAEAAASAAITNTNANTIRTADVESADEESSGDEETDEPMETEISELEKNESVLLLRTSLENIEETEELETINLHTGVNLFKIAITPKMIQTIKAKVLKGIDNTLKPAGECSYYSLLGGLKLLKNEKSVDKPTENAENAFSKSIKPV